MVEPPIARALVTATRPVGVITAIVAWKAAPVVRSPVTPEVSAVSETGSAEPFVRTVTMIAPLTRGSAQCHRQAAKGDRRQQGRRYSDRACPCHLHFLLVLVGPLGRG